MSSARPPRSTEGQLDATRQMLEELDTLMERMLALPVNDLENLPDLPKPPLPATARDVVAVDPSPEASVAESDPDPSSESAPESVPHYRVPEIPSYSFSYGDEEADALDPSALDARPAPRQPVEADVETLLPPPLTLNHAGPSAAGSPRPRPAPVLAVPDMPAAEMGEALTSPFLQPLVWCNHVFDRLTLGLGGAGAWLRGAGGRTTLGYVGLSFIILAVLLWLRDWLGWN